MKVLFVLALALAAAVSADVVFEPEAVPINPRFLLKPVEIVSEPEAPVVQVAQEEEEVVEVVEEISEPLAVAVHPKDLIVPEGPEGRVTNGQTAYAGQFKYACALNFHSNAGSWLCTGSMIHSNWFLTAAHCTDGAHSVTINCGGVNRYNPTQYTTVGSQFFRQHSGYNRNTLNNDISVINTGTFAYTNTVGNVNLPKRNGNYNSYAGWWGIVAGWGRTSDASPHTSDNLQWAQLQIISNAQCQQTYGSSTVIHSTLCAATPGGKGTCNGDSGGPFAIQENGGYTQVGVTSFVSGAGCQAGHPDGFVRVTSFLDWIKQQTGLNI